MSEHLLGNNALGAARWSTADPTRALVDIAYVGVNADARVTV